MVWGWGRGTMEHSLTSPGVWPVSRQHSPSDAPWHTSRKRHAQSRRISWGMGRGGPPSAALGVRGPFLGSLPQLPTRLAQRMSSACLVCDVANFAVQGGPVGQAHSQEGGPQVTCGHLGNVSLGPAGHATKHRYQAACRSWPWRCCS